MSPSRILFFAALIAFAFARPPRAPAEDQDNGGEEQQQQQQTTEQPATGSATTDADAPAVETPAPRARPRQRPAPDRAAPRNPDGGGGEGGGGGGTAPHEQPAHSTGGDQGGPSTPGQPSPGSMNCDLPPLHHINVEIRGGNGNRMIADATPIVCSTDPGTKHERYCQVTMNDDHRRCCPAKPEGHPMRAACEIVLLGKDPSDGVPGPRWSLVSGNGLARVEKREDNPFLAFVYGSGTVRVCSNVVKVCADAPYKVK